MGKRDMPALTVEKAYAIGVFQCSYLLTDGRLGKKKLSCGLGKATGESNFLKGTELIYFHKKTLWQREPHIICILS